ncbi:hypothetical protein OIV83_002955 [Microbotryomycetes sp. JL201]|nr:hypothetical protein OIV83_002955 [Microbotryomycetes sp. JL201]
MPSVPSTQRVWAVKHPLKKDCSNLTLESRPVQQPQGTQVLVKVRAVSLNARDVQIRTYPAPVQVQDGIIGGSDAAGDVICVGDAATRFKVGDKVISLFATGWLHGEHDDSYQTRGLGGGIDGVLQEYFLCDEQALVTMPTHMSYEEASTLPVAALTAWHALWEVPGCVLIPGQTVLVLGTGGVSMAAAQFALAAGCKVIATSSSDDKLEKIKQLGVHAGVNYRNHPEWHDEVIKANGGRGVDHVIEVGGRGTLVRSIRATRPLGHVWIIGYMSDYQTESEERPEYAKEILYTQAVVHGIVCGSRDMCENMVRASEAKQIHPVVDKVFNFEDTVKAYQYLDSGAHFGKVCISLD